MSTNAFRNVVTISVMSSGSPASASAASLAGSDFGAGFERFSDPLAAGDRRSPRRAAACASRHASSGSTPSRRCRRYAASVPHGAFGLPTPHHPSRIPHNARITHGEKQTGRAGGGRRPGVPGFFREPRAECGSVALMSRPLPHPSTEHALNGVPFARAARLHGRQIDLPAPSDPGPCAMLRPQPAHATGDAIRSLPTPRSEWAHYRRASRCISDGPGEVRSSPGRHRVRAGPCGRP